LQLKIEPPVRAAPLYLDTRYGGLHAFHLSHPGGGARRFAAGLRRIRGCLTAAGPSRRPAPGSHSELTFKASPRTPASPRARRRRLWRPGALELRRSPDRSRPYQVAFAESVDKAVPVDWKGGKPWRAVLSDTIRPLGLTVSVAGAAVMIQTAKSPP
jgi:hypothetical protein